jgi:hypothetical protein
MLAILGENDVVVEIQKEEGCVHSLQQRVDIGAPAESLALFQYFDPRIVTCERSAYVGCRIRRFVDRNENLQPPERLSLRRSQRTIDEARAVVRGDADRYLRFRKPTKQPGFSGHATSNQVGNTGCYRMANSRRQAKPCSRHGRAAQPIPRRR